MALFRLTIVNMLWLIALSMALGAWALALPRGKSPPVISEKTIKCGQGTCPAEYTCCQLEKDAPPECCLTGAAICNSGGGLFTGWPKFNGCIPQRCTSPLTKLCPGSKRNTCCKPTQECDTSWGIAFCKEPACDEHKRCNGSKLCCTSPGICKEFRNVEFCAEECQQQAKVSCRLVGNYYGNQPLHICCPAGTCRNHPDGWPYCKGEVN